MKNLKTHLQATLCCLVALLWIASASLAQTQAPATPTVPTAPTAPTARESFLAGFPAIPGVVVSRIGNSSGGTTATVPTWGRNKFFWDGHNSPVRLSIPTNAKAVALETSPDGKIRLIRIVTGWNEGGWHEVYCTDEGRVVAGLWDVPMRGPDDPTSGNGLWVEEGWPKDIAKANATGYDPSNVQNTEHDDRSNVKLIHLQQGPDSGVPGYSWDSTPAGLVIKTPKTTLYGLVPFETVVTDPKTASLVFSQRNWFTLNWTAKGSGKEVKAFGPSYDFVRYPTDPRRTPAPLTHPGPLAAVRAENGSLYVFSGENEILLHQWDEAAKVLKPIAAVYMGPNQLPESIPGQPSMTWGQWAINRVGPDGNFLGDRWQVVGARDSGPGIKTFDANGNLWYMPHWERNSGHDGMFWQVFDPVRGVFSPDNIKTLALPDALKTADKCVQTRLDFKTGDLYAAPLRDGDSHNGVVGRGQWRLERYKGWRDSTNKAAILPSYSVGPIALTTRVEYNWFDRATGESFGSMVPLGDYVFIAEAQDMGLRIHRASDGAIIGRYRDQGHTNSTIDHPDQMQVTETATEFRVFLMDFHGRAALVYRISKDSLKGLK